MLQSYRFCRPGYGAFRDESGGESRSMNLQPGVILDNRYELLELLGEGGMGQVFKARHKRLGKLFAVKSLRNLSPDPHEQAKFLDAFESEARTLAELDHRALAKVSDFFEMGNIHFLVMEFIDGKTLARVVELAPEICLSAGFVSGRKS